MFKSRRTYLFAFVVSGIAVGLTIYLYNRKRQKEHDKNSEDKVTIQIQIQKILLLITAPKMSRIITINLVTMIGMIYICN